MTLKVEEYGWPAPDGGELYRVTEATYLFGSSVPEPSTLALLGIGLVGLIGYGWRRGR